MDAIKNLVYAGVGLASTATDKVKQSINDLVEKGKISDTEGKRIIDEIFKTTESTKEEIENKVKTLTDKFSSTFDFKGKKEDVKVIELQKKIEALEKQLSEAKKQIGKTPEVTSKTATVKQTTAATTKKVAPKKIKATTTKSTTAKKATK
jgi:polyhydroxyalkanoate synthesis regulator phasin